MSDRARNSPGRCLKSWHVPQLHFQGESSKGVYLAAAGTGCGKDKVRAIPLPEEFCVKASGNHLCCPLESAQQDLFVLGMGRGACRSVPWTALSAAGEELLFLPLSFCAPMAVEGCRPKAPSVGSTTYCLGMATGKNVRVASCG